MEVTTSSFLGVWHDSNATKIFRDTRRGRQGRIILQINILSFWRHFMPVGLTKY
jgi:hypothetical protein